VVDPGALILRICECCLLHEVKLLLQSPAWQHACQTPISLIASPSAVQASLLQYLLAL
jgi:hypothetical protein